MCNFKTSRPVVAEVAQAVASVERGPISCNQKRSTVTGPPGALQSHPAPRKRIGFLEGLLKIAELDVGLRPFAELDMLFVSCLFNFSLSLDIFALAFSRGP